MADAPTSSNLTFYFLYIPYPAAFFIPVNTDAYPLLSLQFDVPVLVTSVMQDCAEFSVHTAVFEVEMPMRRSTLETLMHYVQAQPRSHAKMLLDVSNAFIAVSDLGLAESFSIVTLSALLCLDATCMWRFDSSCEAIGTSRKYCEYFLAGIQCAAE